MFNVLFAWNKKKNEGMIKQRWLFLAEQEQVPFCKCGAIPLQLAIPQKLLQKCLIVFRLLTMFTPNFFRLSRCWVSNKDDSAVGRNFPRVISKYLLE